MPVNYFIFPNLASGS